jgi:transcription elongation factor S-II
MATTTAEELSKLISTALECAAAAGSDAAEADRAVGALKTLQKLGVTAALLKETEAGKRVNKLSKSGVGPIAEAAAAVVAAWKECVKKEQGARGGAGATSSSGLPRAGSFASSDAAVPPRPASSGGPPAAAAAPEPPSSSQQQAASQPQRAGSSGGAAVAAGGVAPAPKSGNAKRDKARAMVLEGLALCLGEGVEPVAPLGQLAAEVEEALWAANCEGARDPNAAYLSKVGRPGLAWRAMLQAPSQ